ncbi:MAG: RIP metalloprotease RseP [Bacteroidota bacterium]|nr:RIP metalloprotease RseP [Bacteroidota bacterium]MDP4212985.1 RIP metalloprotease RseP [Bacteroidota bacterium]MDP4249973.1 RIP metalloprotease RseP [Bacteroidota bacterium]
MNNTPILMVINWADAGIKAVQLILSLSLIVIVHEFGHYIPAKFFKCRVEKFFLFFDPWFALVKKKIGETVYGIGWLPLGGYVKIAGMVDESMDKEQMKQPPQPWEFRSKPAWQRLIIMIGGVTMNVIMAFAIYAMILYTWGEKKIPMSGLTYGVSVTDSLMYEMGFRDGDKILSVNGEPVVYFEDLPKKLLMGENVELERDGVKQTIHLPVNLLGKLIEKKRTGQFLFLPRVPVIADVVPDSLNAYKAGLRRMDRILTVHGISTPFYEEYKHAIDAHKGQNIDLTVERGGIVDTLHAEVRPDGTLGFFRVMDMDTLDSLGLVRIERKQFGFFASFPAGIQLAGETLKSYIDQFKKILSPKTGAYKGVGGFKAIGSIFPSMWDWQSFWTITAFLSIALAFMNILPIPALDGGHVLFTLLEMITGRKPSQKLLEYAQVVGMILLLGLMIYANGNDWFGWGKGK